MMFVLVYMYVFLFAFVPVLVQNQRWSIAVQVDYDGDSVEQQERFHRKDNNHIDAYTFLTLHKYRFSLVFQLPLVRWSRYGYTVGLC